MSDTKVSLLGKHRAKVIDSEFGYAGEGDDAKPQVALMFELTEEGPLKGRTISWFGYFTPNAQDRTFDSLRYCGWDTDDLEQLGSRERGDGVYKNEIDLVIEEDTYNGKTRPKVRWVNRASKRELDLKHKMGKDALHAFALQMHTAAQARRLEDPSQRFQQRAQQQHFDDSYAAEREYRDEDSPF